MKFEAFNGLEFEIKKGYRVSKSIEKAYDIILKPIFDNIGIGNARLWLLTSKRRLKIVYGFGPTRNKEKYYTKYNTTEKYRDEHMIKLLQTNPEKFDREYSKRVYLKTRENQEKIQNIVNKERLEGKINLFKSFSINHSKSEGGDLQRQ
jgi:hypothetical protein